MRTEILGATLQKSYYGKAKVIFNDDGTIVLHSYETDVAMIKNGELIRLWNGWSATTMKHIKDFCIHFEIPYGNKKWWMGLPCENTMQFRVVGYNGIGMKHVCPAIYDDIYDANKEAERLSYSGNPFWVWCVEEI